MFEGMEAPPPELDALGTKAMHCWNFCGGWEPANLPIYAALFPVDDWHALIDAMNVIKGNI